MIKVCALCGEEIGTKDGENLCDACDQERISKAKRAKANAQRRARDQALRDLGMRKVLGNLGGTYLE